ncbi:MAG: AsmA family protein [Burkholderiales bacterium]
MRWLKLGLVATGVLVLALAAALAYIAATFDPNRYKGDIEQVVKERTGRTLKFVGDLGLAFWPSLGVRVGRVTLSRRASAHEFASLDSARVAVAVLPLLRGEVLVDEVHIDGLKASVIRAKGGKFDFEDLLAAGGKAGPAPQPARAAGGKVKFNVAGFHLKDAALAYVDEGSGQKLEVRELSLDTGRIADDVPGRLSLSAHIVGSTPELDLKLALEGTYRLALARQEYDLTGMTLKMDGRAADIKRLGLAVTGDARANVAKESVDADLVAKFDDTTAKAKVGMSDFGSPRYRFDVDVDRIDVDRYMAKEGGGAPASPGAAKPAADTPVDLSALEGLQVDGSLEVGSLKAMGLRLTELKAKLKAAHGHVELAPHSAKLYEGALQGALGVTAKGNRIALKESLAGVAVGPLVKDLTGRDAIEGRGKVALDVTTAGPTVNALKKALAGSARVELRDGAVKGINLTEALRKAKAALGSKSAQAQPSDASQRTDFSALTASFAIRNGVAHNDDLAVLAPLLRVGGAGDIDIGGSRLDYLAKATVVASAKGQGGAGLEQLNGLTIPVTLTGPFDAPKYEIDYRQVASSAAKAQAKEALKGKEDEAKAKLKDKLRNFLKR